MMPRVLLIDEDSVRLESVVETLTEQGCDVVAWNSIPASLDKLIQAIEPHVIIMDVESPNRDMLEHVCMVSRSHASPVILFSANDGAASIREAVQAGVSAYIVGDVRNEKILPVIAAAMEQFRHHKLLRELLAEADRQLKTQNSS